MDNFQHQFSIDLIVQYQKSSRHLVTALLPGRLRLNFLITS